jgi:hypothetical protein
MCDPVTIGYGLAAAVAAVGVVSAKEQASAQQKVIDNQSAQQAIQISQQAGQQESIAATQARAQRAQSIVAAGGAGVNLGSNSFIGSLQTTTMNQYNENGLILDNEKNAQDARVANTDSLLASKASSPTFLGGALDVALAGESAYMKGSANYKVGAATASGGSYDSSGDPVNSVF